MQGTEYANVQVSNMQAIAKNGKVLGTRGWMTVRDKDTDKFQWSGAFVAWGDTASVFSGTDSVSNPDATGGDVLFTVEEGERRERKPQLHSPVFHITGYHSKRAPREKGAKWLDQFVIEAASASLTK
jgi:hypothetical protein